MTTTDARPLVDETPDAGVPTCAGAGLDPGPAPDETAGAMLARLGTDAQAWAWEFVRRFAGETVGESKVDVGLMIGWFANAIEIGRSAGQSAPLGLPVGELSAGEVTVPLYVHLDGRDPICVGTIVVPTQAATGEEPFTIAISPDMVDRSQWVERADYDGACKTIAEMHEAATGRRGEAPARGVVEDVADVRARMLAADEALSNALAEQAARPVAAHECAEQAAAILRQGGRLAAASMNPIDLSVIAEGWRQLGVALAQHSGLHRPAPDQPGEYR